MRISECPNDSSSISWMIIEMEHIHITAEQDQTRNSTLLSLLQLKTNSQKITFPPPSAENTHRYEIWWLCGILLFLLIHHNGGGSTILHLPNIFYFFIVRLFLWGKRNKSVFEVYVYLLYTQFINKFKQLY